MRRVIVGSLLQWEENPTADEPGGHWEHVTQWNHTQSVLPVSPHGPQRETLASRHLPRHVETTGSRPHVTVVLYNHIT